MFRIRLWNALLAMLALVLCAGPLLATSSIVVSPTSLTLNCDTVAGPQNGTVNVTLAATGSAINVTATSSSSAVVLPSPAVLSVSSTTVATAFVFHMAAACAGATNNQSVTLTFTPAGGTAVTATATLKITSPSIVSSAAPTQINCDTVLGPTPLTIPVMLAASGSPISVTPSAVITSSGASTSIVTMSPAIPTSVSSTSTATDFTFTLPAGCKGTTNGQSLTLKLTPAGGGDVLSFPVIENITANSSALATSPATVSLACTGTSGSGYTGQSQTVSVTSPANLGTPFTIATPPSGITVSSLTGGTASNTPLTFSVSVTPTQCAALPVGSSSFTLHLVNPPAADKLLPVNVQVGSSSTLVVSPTSIALKYTVNGSLTASGTSQPMSISVASGTAYFQIDPTTIPLWLNVTPASGTTAATSGSGIVSSVSFVVTAGVQTLSVGVYTANVHFKVSGNVDKVVPVTLQVSNPAATLSTVEGSSRTVYWTVGTSLPTVVITPVSSDSPIAYTVSSTAGTLNPAFSPAQGIAYNFGSSPVVVSFSSTVFAALSPGSSVSGTVTLTGANSAGTVNVLITVYAVSPTGASALLTSLSPSVLPTATSGTFTVVLSGSGFILAGGSAPPTQVGIVNGGFIVDPNLTATVVNSTSIVLQIAVPPNDANLPFGTGGSVVIGVCNPQGSGCSSATGTATLAIGSNPIIQGITSASSYSQAAAPALTPVAPYDVISIFGDNFCVSAGTGCTGATTILYGQTDPVTLRYLSTLSPDNSSAGALQRMLTVTFQTHDGNATAIATAPLLFATNNQINVLVPSALTGTPSYVGQTVDVVVSFGPVANPLKSAPFSVTIATTDPGMFTTGGDGQGDAAALSGSYALVNQSTPASARAVATNSDIISLYVTGLGAPDSDGTSSCASIAGYWGNVNTMTSPSTALASADGLVMNSAWYPSGNTLPPCFKTASLPVVKIGGVSVTGATAIPYAGWAPSSVAGLYQIAVQLPASGAAYKDASGNTITLTGTAKSVPVVIQAGGITSQTGVDIWMVKGLTLAVTGSTGTVPNVSVACTSGTALSDVQITDDGTGTHTYTVVSGTLPGGAAVSIGSDGTITGTPSASGASTTVVVNVVDGNGLQGTLTITFNS